MKYVCPDPDWKLLDQDRAKRFRGIVEESIDEAAETPVDLSSANASIRLRIMPVPIADRTVADALIDTPLAKVGDGTAGKFEDYVTVTAYRGQVEVELLLVDAAVTSQPTPTTYREEVLARWLAEVGASVQP